MYVTKLWELGYESYRYDIIAYKEAERMKKLSKSKGETMQTVVYMAKVIAKMVAVSTLRADKFTEERGSEPAA